MRIEGFRREDGGAAARVVFEDSPKPPVDLYFRGTGVEPSPAAFLCAALWPAYHAGERRIAVDGALCPRLRDGMAVHLRVLAGWYPSARPLPVLEPRDGFRAARPAPVRRTGMFLSGGVDSFALLRANRACYPEGHPLRAARAFFVQGLDIAPGRAAFFERALRSLAPAAAEAGIEIAPVRTNVRALDDDGATWPDAWFGSATIAVAHAFPDLTDVFVASSLDVEGLAPMGSHPMLDPYLSSGALQVHHEGLHLSRLQRIRMLADWPAALAALRVCWQDLPEDGPLNCGVCRKCVRARLGFLAAGVRAPTLPGTEITTRDLKACTVDRHTRRFYEELVAPLAAAGRPDLSRALAGKLRAARRFSFLRRSTGGP